jgi:hypothetical protein
VSVTSVQQLPRELPGYPEWAGVRILLGEFDNDARVWAHVDYGEQAGGNRAWLQIDWDTILEQAWSGSQRRLLTAACAIWTGRMLRPNELAGGELGDHGWRLFVLALDAYREACLPTPPKPPVLGGVDVLGAWREAGYTGYDNNPGQTLVPVPTHLHNKLGWAIEDLEDTQEAVNQWLEANGYPTLAWRP